MIKIPPTIDVKPSALWLNFQSTRVTRKMVRSAATDERTGEVREIRTKNDPEKAGGY